jgi:hypothetical protein
VGLLHPERRSGWPHSPPCFLPEKKIAKQAPGLLRWRGICLSAQPFNGKREEAKRLFDELSAGGTVEMPIQDMFWGAYYGSFTDKFGINWMINFQNPQA